MNKIQTIIWLLILLVIIISMDQIFGNPIRETFKGIEKPVGYELNYRYDPNKKMDQGYGFLAAEPPNSLGKSDDQPMHFSYPLSHFSFRSV